MRLRFLLYRCMILHKKLRAAIVPFVGDDFQAVRSERGTKRRLLKIGHDEVFEWTANSIQPDSNLLILY